MFRFYICLVTIKISRDIQSIAVQSFTTFSVQGSATFRVS